MRSSIQRLVDGLSASAAVFVRNGRLDVLASNTKLRALYVDAFDNPARPVNLARFVFLDPRAHWLHPNWSTSADTTVAILRTEAGRNPYDKSLVGELSTRSPESETRRARTTSACTGPDASTSTTAPSATLTSPWTPSTCPTSPA